MRIAQIGFHRDPSDRAPEELLHAWPTLVDIAESVAGAGFCASVIQSSGHRRRIRRNGVDYHFIPLGGANRHREREVLAELVREIAPDALHVHGLGFPRQVSALAAAAPQIPLLLQDHADHPPRWWRRPAWRQCRAHVSAVAFCSRQQAKPFLDAGLFRPEVAVYEVPESSSRFVPGDRDRTRREYRLTGDPLLLWVGHLDHNKDPLTVLDGIGEAACELPGLELWCCFANADLLHQVRRRIGADPRLAGRVHLLGERPHAEIGKLMAAADAFVSGSHREGSGYALIEALACGLPPVVTDIPSFRALTGGAAVGRLWSPGDPHSLCAALLDLVATAGPQSRAEVRLHFERELSFEAVGRKLAVVYEDLQARHRPGPGTIAPIDGAAHAPRT